VQVAARCAPEHLSIRVFADPTSSGSWNWTGRLPHLAAQRGEQPPASYVASDPQVVGRGIGELVAEIESRGLSKRPEIIAVFDRASVLRQVDGVVGILSKGPEVGVYPICVGGEDEMVPESRSVVRCSPEELTLIRSSAGEQGGITPDLVSPAWCERVAAALAARGSAG
jgi:DNA segregation ATPase FtsK/SpoIIIE, S-DNA-T family